jgi:hypothetical protein
MLPWWGTGAKKKAGSPYGFFGWIRTVFSLNFHWVFVKERGIRTRVISWRLITGIITEPEGMPHPMALIGTQPKKSFFFLILERGKPSGKRLESWDKGFFIRLHETFSRYPHFPVTGWRRSFTAGLFLK